MLLLFINQEYYYIELLHQEYKVYLITLLTEE